MVDKINTNLDTNDLPQNTYKAKDREAASLANWIRQKTYGRHVRESIARFVELTSDKVFDTVQMTSETVRVANETQERLNQQIGALTEDSEVIDARGGKATLGQRLDANDLDNSINTNLNNKTILGDASFSLDFERITSQPILNSDNIGWDDLAFPTLIRATDYLDNPIDKYYLYISQHDKHRQPNPTGVHLFTAPTITGPFTHQKEVISASQIPSSNHAAALEVVWVPEKKIFYGYAHGYVDANGTQPNFIFTSPDGLTFTKMREEPMVPVGRNWYADTSFNYARVFRFKGKWFAFGQTQGADNGMQRQAMYYSDNGLDWYPDMSNPVEGATFGKSWGYIFCSSAIPIGDAIYIFMDIPTDGWQKRRIYLAKTYDGSHYELVSDTPVLDVDANSVWENGDIQYPYAYLEDGYLYLFYVADTIGKNIPRNLGVARVAIYDDK